MKKRCAAAVFFFVCALVSVCAQDLIVLKTGNIIEAKIMEISPAEVRYKRFNNLDGPTIVLPVADILSIRYENGIVEIINKMREGTPIPVPAAVPAPEGPPERKTAMNRDKVVFGMYADPSGFLTSGPVLALEWTKGGFNTQFSLRVPFAGLFGREITYREAYVSNNNVTWDPVSYTDSTGIPSKNGTLNIDKANIFPAYSGDYRGFHVDEYIGIGLGFNYFHHSRAGGFYIGGYFEFSYGAGELAYNSVSGTVRDGYYDKEGKHHETQYDENDVKRDDWVHSKDTFVSGTVSSDYQYKNFYTISIAVNTGFKFVLSPGVYFRTGAYLGTSIDSDEGRSYFYIRPDITVGYNF